MTESKGTIVAGGGTRQRGARQSRPRGCAAAALLGVGVVAGCGDEPRAPVDEPAGAPIEQPDGRSRTEEARPGIRFDPGAVAPGDTVGDLVVDSITAGPNVVDSTFVGSARFSGRVELTGRTVLHPEDDLRATMLCFEADPASAARLPRWAADERRPWFCFANQRAAVEALGPPGEERGATIVVDDFTIHRNLSDAVNSARFVRRVGGGR